MPVIRDKIQSKLNNFEEYTILDADDLAEFVGFTSEEVKTLCADHCVNYDECKLWYDRNSQHGYEIYNPESVMKCITKHRFTNYWGKTSSYTVILDRIHANFDGMKDDVIRMMAGDSIDVDVEWFMNTMTDFTSKDDAFTYLIHTGYLAYNLDNSTCRIPNNEIRREWKRALADDSNYTTTDQIISDSKKLLEETWNENTDAVAKALDSSHINVTSNRSYNNEDALQCAIYLAYFDALNYYTVIREMTAGKGFADMVYIPINREKHPAMIIELKNNKTSESAIEQIRNRHYFDSLSHYQGNLLFIGINYDEKNKTHKCRIERFIK